MATINILGKFCDLVIIKIFMLPIWNSGNGLDRTFVKFYMARIFIVNLFYITIHFRSINIFKKIDPDH